MDFAGLNITEKLILEAEVEKKKNVFLICLKVFLRSTFWLGEQENGQQKLCQKLASFFAKVRLCVWLDDYFFATYSNKTLPNCIHHFAKVGSKYCPKIIKPSK